MGAKISIDPLPQLTGIPESSLRLLIVLLLGYPIAYVYRVWALPRWSGSPDRLNAFNAVAGVSLAYFFCGTDIVHSIVTLLVSYVVCARLGPSRPQTAAAIIFVWNMGYLLVGYYLNHTAEYQLGWTCPQCVLCLKLIGYGMDVYDGQRLHRRLAKSDPDAKAIVDKKLQEASADKNKTGYARPLALFDDKFCPIMELPSLTQLFGFAYHPTSFLVGPQMTFAFYKASLERGALGAEDPVEMAQDKQDPTAAQRRGMGARDRRAFICFSLGVLYLAGRQIMGIVMPAGAMLSTEAESWSMLRRLTYMIISHKGVLMQYVGVWLLSEGACVMSGLGYNGIDNTGKSRWDGLANVYSGGLELATSLSGMIASFNVNTNRWSKRYIFKRLRFLGNKHLSSLGTVSFLALWHGFHPGYLMCFGMEFLDMEAERRVAMLWRRATGGRPVEGAVATAALAVIGWLWSSGQLMFALAAMEQRVFSKAWAYWTRMHFVGLWLSLGLVVFTIVMTVVFRPTRRPLPTAEGKATVPVPVVEQEVRVGPTGRRASVVEEKDDLTAAAASVAAAMTEFVKERPIMRAE